MNCPLINLPFSDDLSDIGKFSEIKLVNFSILSAEDIKKISVVKIVETKLEGYESVNDPKMGIIENHKKSYDKLGKLQIEEKKCETCNGSNIECPGHFGHIELFYPIAHPLFCPQILSYLRLFCEKEKCGALLITVDEMKLQGFFKLKGINRFNAILDYITKKVDRCRRSSCNEKQSKYNFNDGKFFKIFEQDDRKEMLEIKPYEILDIFSNISQNALKLLGFTNEYIHPQNLILTVLPVIPLTARPYVETNGRPCDDDLTTKYVEIIKVNNKLNPNPKSNKPPKEREKGELIEKLEFHIRTLMDNTKGNKARQINGWNRLLTGRC